MRLLVAAGFFLASSALASAQNDGFVPLFNGKDLEGWEIKQAKPSEKDKWSYRDGALVGQAGSGWIGTKRMYGDFVVKLEWKVPVNGNSGVFLRVPDVESKNSPSQLGMEIQILDDHGPAYKGKLKDWQYSGSLYTFFPRAKDVFKGAGEWNAYEIACVGDRVSVVYNGEKVVDADMKSNPELNKRPRRGFLGLQNHGTGIEFRNVMIKSLDRP